MKILNIKTGGRENITRQFMMGSQGGMRRTQLVSDWNLLVGSKLITRIVLFWGHHVTPLRRL